MKDGDIFSWEWKPEMGRPYGDYHCKSQIAVFDGTTLRDTFWSNAYDGALDPAQVDLTYRGNKHEMTTILERDEPFYRHEDLVIMRHSNDSNAPTYLKAGAVKDAERMREETQHALDRAISDKRSAEFRIERYQEALSAIARGDLDKVYL